MNAFLCTQQTDSKERVDLSSSQSGSRAIWVAQKIKKLCGVITTDFQSHSRPERVGILLREFRIFFVLCKAFPVGAVFPRPSLSREIGVRGRVKFRADYRAIS